MRTVSIAPLIFVATLASCGGHDADPQVRHAWVRLPAVAGRPAAAYFEIKGGARDAKLVKVESALAVKAELHESMEAVGGMAAMKPLSDVRVPAGENVRFAPGGRHVMLFGLDKVVQPGTAIPLRLGFAGGATAEAEAKTVGAGEDAPY